MRSECKCVLGLSEGRLDVSQSAFSPVGATALSRALSKMRMEIENLYFKQKGGALMIKITQITFTGLKAVEREWKESGQIEE